MASKYVFLAEREDTEDRKSNIALYTNARAANKFAKHQARSLHKEYSEGGGSLGVEETSNGGLYPAKVSFDDNIPVLFRVVREEVKDTFEDDFEADSDVDSEDEEVPDEESDVPGKTMTLKQGNKTDKLNLSTTSASSLKRGKEGNNEQDGSSKKKSKATASASSTRNATKLH